MEEENRLIQERIRKISEIREKGIDPYPYSFDQKEHAVTLQKKYSKLKAEEKTSDKAKVAGRVMAIRRMGKASFAQLVDTSGKIQLYLNKDNLAENYNLFKKVDIGDWIGCEGIIFKTKTGELTIEVKKYSILCKTIRPLPEKFHGLKDEEIRYRHREVDLIMNPEVKEIFVKRALILDAVKEFMKGKGFLEVDTPTLQLVYGGAEARPFKTHINAWNLDLFLRISPELHLKRLIVGGYEKVFTICKNFRNEGVDKTHNPEFTMMEFYQAYADYEEIMKVTEELFEYVSKKINGSTKIEYQDRQIELKAPWPRLSVKEALKKFGDLDVDELSDEELRDQLLGYNIEYEGDFTRGLAIMMLFEYLVEEKLEQPVFIIDYPKEASPLCKAKRGDPELIEKVEPYVNGWEMGNGYSELNDPIKQRELLEEQAKQLRAGVEEKHPMDEEFVQAIETGMPPTGGMGIGLDRLIILLTNQASLRETLLFPTMKPEESKKEVKKEKKK